jgi:hypothetical protein
MATLRAAPCPSCAVSEPQRVRAAPCPSCNVCEPRRVRAAPCPSRNVSEPRRVRAAPCPSRNVSEPRRVRAATVRERWRNPEGSVFGSHRVPESTTELEAGRAPAAGWSRRSR